MRNDFGTRPYKSRFPYAKGGDKKQGYDARLDESLGARPVSYTHLTLPTIYSV